jgi:plastocyanin
MRNRCLAGLMLTALAAALLAAPSAAGPPPAPVNVVDNAFEPKAASQILGSSTLWTWDPGNNASHNVRQDKKLFRSGPPELARPGGYSVVISAGTFHYYCELHGSPNGGMAGKVKVKPQVYGTVQADEFPVRWNDGGSTGDQFDVRWRLAGQARYKPWLTNTGLSAASFGAGNDPVDVKPGKTYLIQARSELSTNPDRRSGWSPALRVTP